MKQLLFKWAGYDRVQRIIESDAQLDGLAFISRVIKEFNIEYQVQGAIAPNVRSTVFICTHHVGAIDFLTVYPTLKQVSSQLKVVANKQLLRLKPLRGDFIVVHPISAKMSNVEAKTQLADHLKNGGNILVYPAGKIAKKEKGIVSDFEWRLGMFSIMQKHSQQIIPIFVSSENSNFFYFIRGLFPKLSLFLILRALTARKKEVVKVIIGKPVESKDLQSFSASDGMNLLRQKTYELREKVGDKRCN